MQDKYKSKDAMLLALTDEPSGVVGPFVEKNKINYPVGFDAGATRRSYGARGYPTVLVFNRDGKLVYQGHDPLAGESALEQALTKPASTH